jgi:hypothetical protein
MAKDKKSFVLYADLIHTVKQLPSDKAGDLFKHILSYVNDENPETDDIIVKIAFEPIKQQLKRDLNKWDDIRKKRSEAGKSSANKRKEKKAKATSVKSVKQTLTNSTVNDNVNVNVSVTSIEKRKADFKELIKDVEAERRSDGQTPYSKQLLKDFFEYWSEYGVNDKKMRYEKQDSFSVKRRLSTWKRNETKFEPQKDSVWIPPKLKEL